MNRKFVLLACALLAQLLCHGDAVRGQSTGDEPNLLRYADAPAPAIAAPATVESPPPIASDAAATAEEDDEAKAEATIAAPDAAVKTELDARLKALENAALSDDDKRKAVEFYQQAIDSFEVATQQIAAAKKFQEQLNVTKLGVVDSDPEKNGKYSTQDYAQRLAKPLPPYEDVTGEPLEKVEQRAALLETSLAKYRKDLAEMTEAPKFRSQRMAELPKQLAETQQKLKQTTDELAALGSEDMADVLMVARRAMLTQSQAAHQATLYALRREQRLYEESGEWVKVRRDYFARYVPHKEKRLVQLREHINRERENAAQQQARLAAQAVEEVKDAQVTRPKALTELANKNKTLAEQRAELSADITLVSKQLDSIRQELRQLDEQFDRSKKQDEVDELSHLNGQLLRDQKAKLPDIRALRRRHALREGEQAEILLRVYNLSDDASSLANIDELADAMAAQASDASASLRAEFHELLTAQRKIVDDFIKDGDGYSKNLAELSSAEADFIYKAEQYAAFIAERVLWIRSAPALSRAELRPAMGAVAWSLDPRNWRDAGAAVVSAGSRQPAQFTLFVVGFAVLMASQSTARRRLRELGAEADKRSCIHLQPTFNALGLTAVIALPWPVLMAFVGWSMDGLNESEFVRALSMALKFSALCMLVLQLSRHLCRFGGLADCHYDWPDACIAHVRSKLRWLTLLGAPLVLWLVGLEVQEIEPLWSSSLGRMSFIAVMLLLSTVLQRLLLARNSPFRQLVLVSGGGWLTPLQITWRPALVLLPAALAALAAVGYYYTAQQAALRLLETVAMLLSVMNLGGVTRRWLLVNRRRLAREQAKQRRAQMAAAAEADAAAPPTPELADDAIDLAAVSVQTQKLVRTFLAITTAVGLVLIWNEILPALKYPAARTLPWAAVLTWGDLATFLIILGVTYISVRDIPALLELVVLQHLPLDSGSRYAITSISRYVLTAIGLIAAFNCIGGDWGKVQWLVAAMSVGLGFGLQEIFANFVSGVILLFERPIRVGDIVTLGDKSGVVNRIRMRATTIVDWDRKEYIVPNKDLVTGRLLNWTLSDQMNRIEIIIMLSHGADTDLACRLLLDSAREQQHVLPEPQPSAVFEGLSEGGLKLALRCFLPTLEHRGATIHDLHTTIDRKFRKSGVELAAPPREMRMRLLRDEKPMVDARRIA